MTFIKTPYLLITNRMTLHKNRLKITLSKKKQYKLTSQKMKKISLESRFINKCC